MWVPGSSNRPLCCNIEAVPGRESELSTVRFKQGPVWLHPHEIGLQDQRLDWKGGWKDAQWDTRCAQYTQLLSGRDGTQTHVSIPVKTVGIWHRVCKHCPLPTQQPSLPFFSARTTLIRSGSQQRALKWSWHSSCRALSWVQIPWLFHSHHISADIHPQSKTAVAIMPAFQASSWRKQVCKGPSSQPSHLSLGRLP